MIPPKNDHFRLTNPFGPSGARFPAVGRTAITARHQEPIRTFRRPLGADLSHHQAAHTRNLRIYVWAQARGIAHVERQEQALQLVCGHPPAGWQATCIGSLTSLRKRSDWSEESPSR